MHHVRVCLPLSIDLVSESISPTKEEITLRDAYIPTRVCDQICAVAMKAFNYSDVEIDPVRPRNAGRHLRCGVVLAAIN